MDTCAYLEVACLPSEVAFQPSLVPYGSGYLMAFRQDTLEETYVNRPMIATPGQFWGRQRRVIVREINENFRPAGRELVHWEGEDPRLFKAMNQTWCAYSTCPRSWRVWLMEVSMTTGKLGEPFLPAWGRNPYLIGGPDEKNWTWINGAHTLDCVQMWQPFRALRFAPGGDLIDNFQMDARLSWRFGPIWGGTPSVLLPSGERFSVFHGFLRGGRFNRCYFGGGIYHEPEWPYRPIKILHHPLLAGARRIKRWPWMQCQLVRPRVVYPCGLIAKPDRLIVSYGVDDCACATAEVTYDELIEYDRESNRRLPFGSRGGRS